MLFWKKVKTPKKHLEINWPLPFKDETAQKDSRIGDGYCDDMFNWHVCDFDGGDCCTPANSSTKVNTMFCEDCFCLQNYPVTDKCYFTAKIGNEICDDLANTEECSYDGGKYIVDDF